MRIVSKLRAGAADPAAAWGLSLKLLMGGVVASTREVAAITNLYPTASPCSHYSSLAATPTSRPKPRGVSNAIDGGARHDHGVVRRGSPAETRPARWNLVDARTTSDGGTDGQAYVQGSWKATPTARTGCRASEAWPRRSPFPARAYVFGTQASETASHSSQFERLFLSRIATGRPWPLAKNAQFRRGARRPSDAVAGAKPGFSADDEISSASQWRSD